MSVFSGGGRKLLCRSAAFWPEDVPAGCGKKGDKDRSASGRWGILPPDAIKREKTGGKWRTVSQERPKWEAAEDSVEYRERKVGNREGRWRIEKFF